MLTKNSSVLFTTFSMWENGQRMPTNGNLEPLRDFLVPKVKRLTLMDQPHPGSDIVMVRTEEYLNHNEKPIIHSPSWQMQLLSPLLKLFNKNSTQIIFKVRDFLSVFDLGIGKRIQYDYFVGVECVNTIAGILLKRLGRVRHVIYYVLDYSPNRYKGILNKIYLALDRYCAIHSDLIWDVSKTMQPARIAAGLNSKKSAPVIHVPIGVFPQQLIFTPLSQRIPFSVVYLGTLSEEQGPDLIVECMPKIIKKYPQSTLHIVGGGENNLKRLRALVKTLGIETNTTFYGYVVKNIDMAKILSKCYVAVAPYRDYPESTRKYADASKMRSYAAAGLPIVTTTIPPLGKELHELGGAIIASDNKEGFTKAILSVFSSKKMYANMNKIVVRFAQNNTWDNEFTKAFSKS